MENQNSEIRKRKSLEEVIEMMERCEFTCYLADALYYLKVYQVMRIDEEADTKETEGEERDLSAVPV